MRGLQAHLWEEFQGFLVCGIIYALKDLKIIKTNTTAIIDLVFIQATLLLLLKLQSRLGDLNYTAHKTSIYILFILIKYQIKYLIILSQTQIVIFFVFFVWNHNLDDKVQLLFAGACMHNNNSVDSSYHHILTYILSHSVSGHFSVTSSAH